MGRPVDDRRHSNSLGVILLRQKQNEGNFSGSSSNEGQKFERKPKASDNAVSMQKYSASFPSDRDYSYTEALFTGTPLLNGNPYSSNQGTKSHPSNSNNSNSGDRNSVRPLAEPSVDRNQDPNKQRGNEPGQTESQFEVGEQVGMETHYSYTSSENATDNLKNQYQVNRPTHHKRPYNTQEEDHYNFGPVQADTQQHFARNQGKDGSQSMFKSYDEESNILNPNPLRPGNKIDEHRNHAFNSDFQKTETEHESGGNRAQKPSNEYSNSLFREGSDSSNRLSNGRMTPDSKENLAYQYTTPDKMQTDFSYSPNNQSHPQNHPNESKEEIQNADSNVTHHFVKETLSSTGRTNAADHRMEGINNLLRPHKIIQSSFDQELTHTIVTGPWNQQDRLGTFASQPLSNTSHSDEHSFQTSSSKVGRISSQYHDSDEATLHLQKPFSTASSETDPSSDVQMERTRQQSESIPLPMNSEALYYENKTLNEERGSKEEANTQTSWQNNESNNQRNDGSNQSLQESLSVQSSNVRGSSSSYHEGSNPSQFSSANEHFSERQNHGGSPSSQENPTNSSSRPQMEDSPDIEESHHFAGTKFQGRPVQWTLTNDESLSHEWTGNAPNQMANNKYDKESAYKQGGSYRIQSMTNPQKSSANEYEGDSFKGSLQSSSTTPLNLMRHQGQLKNREDASNQINEDKNYFPYSEKLQNSLSKPTRHDHALSGMSPTGSSLSSLESQPEFQVGVAEQVEEMRSGYQSPRANETQQHTESTYYGKASEKTGNQTAQENDHDNKNQKIVYFLKMAKGIPLLNKRPIDDQRRQHNDTHKSESPSSNEMEQPPSRVIGIGVGLLNNKPINAQNRNHYNETHYMGTYVDSQMVKDEKKDIYVDEMVFNEATKKWYRRRRRRRRKPRPSSPYPMPFPIPSPSPATGGAEGALGGSSVDSNVPQGELLKSFYWPSLISFLLRFKFKFLEGYYISGSENRLQIRAAFPLLHQ